MTTAAIMVEIITHPEPPTMDLENIIKSLPADAAERLRAQMRIRDDAGAIMRAVVDRVLKARADRQDGEVRLRQLRRNARPQPSDHPSVQQAQRAIDDANAELLRLANHEATTAATFNHAGRLVTAIERWARDHVSNGRMFAPAPTIEPRLLKNETVVDAIARNRQEIRRLEADLHTCRSAPIPAPEAKAAMREQVAALAARGRPYVEGLIEHNDPISFEALSMSASNEVERRVEGFAPVTVRWSGFDALGLVAWLHQDVLVKRLSAEIDDAADDGAALSSVDRRKREAELLSDIAMTQKQVAALIRLAEAENIAVEFEADTPPEIILGVIVVDSGAPRQAGYDATEEFLLGYHAVQAAP